MLLLVAMLSGYRDRHPQIMVRWVATRCEIR
jgi:hypothetical protein